MIKAECIFPTGDGCSAVCPVDETFAMGDGAELVYQYEGTGLIVEYGGLAVKIPMSLFDHLQDTLVKDEDFGVITKLHLYGKSNDYEAFFVMTLALQAEEFIKAKGVAAYIASNPQIESKV